MITAAQGKDLQPGDVVELAFLHEYDATTITARGTFPAVVDWFENHEGGTYTLTVISRAPRPLYVNSDKTEPDPGDVVRDADRDGGQVWLHADPTDPPEAWVSAGEGFWASRNELPAHLRLLVDGKTGQVVP